MMYRIQGIARATGTSYDKVVVASDMAAAGRMARFSCSKVLRIDGVHSGTYEDRNPRPVNRVPEYLSSFLPPISRAGAPSEKPGTLRPLNSCLSCNTSWYPRGKDISDQCPRCKSSRVWAESHNRNR